MRLRDFIADPNLCTEGVLNSLLLSVKRRNKLDERGDLRIANLDIKAIIEDIKKEHLVMKAEEKAELFNQLLSDPCNCMMSDLCKDPRVTPQGPFKIDFTCLLNGHPIEDWLET
ncbi:MAG: hypothetical protein Q8K86_11610 [Candidatus Nanopelagicaceae bacterium]|nr:hypothetical protein [Candidatus Nanopelagicaceae bacterium]